MTKVVPVSGQTYSRKMDYFVLSRLSGIAQSASKFATDMRSANFKEMEEPFEKQPDRLLCHALQAQSHALRAHLLPWPAM